MSCSHPSRRVIRSVAEPIPRRLLAVGMENGGIMIYSGSIKEPEKWVQRLHISARFIFLVSAEMASFLIDKLIALATLARFIA